MNTRKANLILVLMIISVSLISCASQPNNAPDTPDVLSPSIMIGDVIYQFDGKELEMKPDEREFSGKVKSVVETNLLPSKNEELNMPYPDSPYIILDEGIAVFINSKWLLFEKSSK